MFKRLSFLFVIAGLLLGACAEAKPLPKDPVEPTSTESPTSQPTADVTPTTHKDIIESQPSSPDATPNLTPTFYKDIIENQPLFLEGTPELTPVMFSIDEIGAQASFPVMLPSFTPEGLVDAGWINKEGLGRVFVLTYFPVEGGGRLMLVVMQGIFDPENPPTEGAERDDWELISVGDKDALFFAGIYRMDGFAGADPASKTIIWAEENDPFDTLYSLVAFQLNISLDEMIRFAESFQ